MRLQLWPLCLLAFGAPFSCGPDAPPAARVPRAASGLSSLRSADLERILQYGTPERRLAAAGALRERGRSANESIPTIVESLQDEDPAVVEALWSALTDIGAPPVGSVQRLRCALQEQFAAVRLGAAEVLARMGRDAAEALPELVETLEDRDCSVRLAARHALVSVGNGAVPALLEALADASPGRARHLVEILAALPDGADALSSLGDTAIEQLLSLEAPLRFVGAAPK